ncbi:hypothetical protein FCZ44_30290, partial [Escherichia coli]|nr:hypothetical protein [Escherichia coli]
MTNTDATTGRKGIVQLSSATNSNSETLAASLYIDLCNCLILICSIQHQMKVNLWTKNSYRLWLT